MNLKATAGRFYQDRLRMHSSGSMQMTFSPLLIHKPEKMIVSAAEYHNYTQEGVLCLDDDVIVHVAPAGKEPVPELNRSFSCAKGNYGASSYRSMAFKRDSCK